MRLLHRPGGSSAQLFLIAGLARRKTRHDRDRWDHSRPDHARHPHSRRGPTPAQPCPHLWPHCVRLDNSCHTNELLLATSATPRTSLHLRALRLRRLPVSSAWSSWGGFGVLNRLLASASVLAASLLLATPADASDKQDFETCDGRIHPARQDDGMRGEPSSPQLRGGATATHTRKDGLDATYSNPHSTAGATDSTGPTATVMSAGFDRKRANYESC